MSTLFLSLSLSWTCRTSLDISSIIKIWKHLIKLDSTWHLWLGEGGSSVKLPFSRLSPPWINLNYSFNINIILSISHYQCHNINITISMSQHQYHNINIIACAGRVAPNLTFVRRGVQGCSYHSQGCHLPESTWIIPSFRWIPPLPNGVLLPSLSLLLLYQIKYAISQQLSDSSSNTYYF